MENLNIALLQVDLFWENIKKNLKLFEEKIESVNTEVDLFILPEMFSTGFSMNAEKLAESENGPTLKWMQRVASEKNAAITGSIIVKEKDEYFNRLYFVFPDSTFKKYDKHHTFTLAKEHETYSAGNERLQVEYKGWKICPLICYDLRFPVWARNTEDYDLLIYVANWPKPRILAWDVLLQARAIENMSYCAGVNRIGLDGNNHEYTGHSAVYDSLGKPLNDQEEAAFTKVVTLDKNQLLDTRKKFKFLQDRDKFTLE
ncbi:amidohydrolase [Gillisia hiemivivida]|uniref:Omega-amidase YafV n=1 Tax=Gillisia hiemivivida TaxID=291190 RepID=A0A5C6ZQV9_9FLAO|nr:amidohydrolase [Gillisia hiemivivida]TXD91987.1 amidohydrolase [Gillisia hiemivivida]